MWQVRELDHYLPTGATVWENTELVEVRCAAGHRPLLFSTGVAREVLLAAAWHHAGREHTEPFAELRADGVSP